MLNLLDFEREVILVDYHTVGEREFLIGTLGNPHHLKKSFVNSLATSWDCILYSP